MNKQLKYHKIDNIEYLKTQSNNKKDSTYFYKINALLSENINAIKIAYNSAGKFILATNVLEKKSLSNVAISGLHKQPRFRIVCPIKNRPVMLDDTCYFISCDSLESAILLACLFNSDICLDFIKSITFLDAKRPITKKLLQSVSFDALLNNIPKEQLIKLATSEYQRSKPYSDKKLECLSALELLSKNIATASAQ